MSHIAYVEGRYVRHADAHVHVEDRGFQFADGVYEVVLLQAGCPVDEALHLDRLERSLRELRIAAPMSRAALRVVMAEIVRRNRLRDGLIYLQITRGVARRDHAFPRAGTRPTLVITARAVAPFPRDLATWSATAVTCPDERWARCDIKSVALLPNVLARQAARERGATEAILYDAEGRVTEGAATTVWIVDEAGRLRTHPLGNAILPGCTRAALMALLGETNVQLAEGPFTLAELRAAREVFLTSATSFVKPVLAVDGQPVGDGRPGRVTEHLFQVFARHVRETVTAGSNSATMM
jgi:D-alanine transaminase